MISWRTPSQKKTKTGAPQRPHSTNQYLLTILILFIFGTSILVKVAGNLWIKRQLRDMGVRPPWEYSYTSSDHPHSWPIPLRKKVLLAFSNPKHYALDTPQGKLEWSSLVPSSPSSPNGIIHLGPSKEPFTISMMHQLKCLDIIRMETMVLCRGDLELESFQFASHKDPIDQHGVYECRDWGKVYEEVKKNQVEYEEWLEESR
ncbi:hypothetical protein NP233_g1828 [Leucocoprinus birnbaumii]|uniref:Uncharacterized protein n=1 Tax=Leucocoprinus birnbaumii TaxID=56174 RepID=A0AAD5YZ90_9AGAR|nr:hypothetical protein NP233_g1828 [Leucocoprinus birnbaumii]